MAEIEKTEKITVNLGLIDLGESTCWSARDSTPTAPTSSGPRSAGNWKTRSTAVKETVARRTLELGSVQYTRAQLEQLRAAGKTAHLRVLGLGSIANDVSSELALATIESVEVLGAFRAAREVKAALSARTA
jgi:hypothetical protein